jgi:hypothetical protein
LWIFEFLNSINAVLKKYSSHSIMEILWHLELSEDFWLVLWIFGCRGGSVDADG